MKIYKQDISSLFFYCVGFSKIRNRFLRILNKKMATFITFHNIMPESFDNFKDNICFLKRHTNVVSLDDFFSANLSSKNINVVITFDDGYKSWLTYAIPLLLEFGLPATFFIASGFVGLSKEKQAEFMRSRLLIPSGIRRNIKGLDFEDLREIIKKGFTIGGHTLSHCNLKNLRNINQIRYEIGKDKIELESETGVKIKYFAYPFGAYINPEIHLIGVLKELGYEGAVTTVPGFNKTDSNPYLLYRDKTDAPMPRIMFKAKVFGNYGITHFIKKRVLGISL